MGAVNYTCLAFDGSGTPYVAYTDAVNSGKATVKKYNGTSWETVGTAGFSVDGAGYTSLALDGSGTPYVAYTDGGNSNKATVMKYNGTSWETVSSAGFSADGAAYTSLALDGSGTPYVAYSDYGNDGKATVMKFSAPPAPTVSSISLTSGSTAGGTSVTITGTDFSGATSVMFGSVAASSFTVNSATSITAITPAGSAGAVDITVTTAGGTSATSSADQFTYAVPAAPSGLSYTTPVVCVKGSSLAASLSPAVTGEVTSYTVSPALPAGLSLNAATGMISGTPTAVSAAADYTVTATNSGGSTTAVINITVNDIAPAISYSTSIVGTIGNAISVLSPTGTGGAVVSYSINPALPAGLGIDSATGMISGRPTAVSAATNYTITASNSGGSTTAVVNITVNDIAPFISYSTPVTFNVGTAKSVSPTSTGGTVISYSISPALHAGLSINSTTGIISGTPTMITASAMYAVTATNSGGSATVINSITVNDALPVISYSSPVVYLTTKSIQALSPTVTGGAVESYSVSPVLPAGLSLSTTTGIISGIPTAISAAKDYTITATNGGGSTTAVVTITVNDGSVISIDLATPSTTPIVGCENNNLSLAFTLTNGAPTQYKITYSAAAVAAGMQNVSYTSLSTSSNGDVPIAIPKGALFGTYSGVLQLKNDAGVESVPYSFTFTVNVSPDYIIPKFDDVVLCDNSSHLFTAYQWYKNEEAISGATKQFYNDPNGLVGSYSLKVTTVDGQVLYSCDKYLNIPLAQKVTAYPSKIVGNQVLTVKVTGMMDEDLEGATLSVYTMQGVRVYRSTEVKVSNSVTLPSIDGMYLGRVITSTGKEFQFKVIVAK